MYKAFLQYGWAQPGQCTELFRRKTRRMQYFVTKMVCVFDNVLIHTEY